MHTCIDSHKGAKNAVPFNCLKDQLTINIYTANHPITANSPVPIVVAASLYTCKVVLVINERKH